MTNNNEIKNITFQEKWQEFKHNWSDPTKKRVRNRKVGRAVGNFLRTFILIGLCFI